MITNAQRKSQVEKISGATAILFSAVDDLNNKELSNEQVTEMVAQDVDTTIKILEAVRAFLEARR